MYPNLEAEIARFKLTNAALAKELNMTEKSFSNKRTGKTDFTVHEAFILKRQVFKNCTLEYLFAESATVEQA